MIAIVDYNLGNVGSIKNMLEHIGFLDVRVTGVASEILQATHVILPGVGSFDQGMANLTKRGLDQTLRTFALNLKKPLLGICLGMQLLGEKSEEGQSVGLGLLPFKTVKFMVAQPLKIPHMGWNTISIKKPHSLLLQGMDNQHRFYFVHSYHAISDNEDHIIMTTDYGYEVAIGLEKDQIYGVQFHPEKSHHFGMKLFTNFLRIPHVQ